MNDGEPARPRRGDLLALISAVFAAVFLLAFRAANEAAPRDAAVFAMLACSTVFNAGFAASRLRARPSRPPKVAVVATLVLAVLTILGNVGVAGALTHLDPGLTSTILQTQVFFVGLGGWLFLGEKVTPAFVIGAGFAVGGFGVIAIDDPSEASIEVVGVLFALLGSLGFGTMLLYTRKVITRIDPVGVNVARLALAVLVMGLWLGPTGGLARLPVEAWAMTALAAACGPFISRLCLMFAVRHISASRAKLLTLLTPIFAFSLEVAFLGSWPSLRELGGAALILAGVVLPVLSGRVAPPDPRTPG